MDLVHRHVAVAGDNVPQGVHIYCFLQCNCSSVNASLLESFHHFSVHPPLARYTNIYR